MVSLPTSVLEKREALEQLRALENGMDVIRIFDALNDVNNMKVAMEACVNAGSDI